LQSAGIAPEAIDYVNAHGTATRNNDDVEAAAAARVVGPDTPITSTKGFMGHTLGAAGAISAAVSLASLEGGFIPGTVHTTRVDERCGRAVQLTTRVTPVCSVLANAFGFGGSNASLVFGMRP
jgi:3-oxoacyl-[acyl-carrier-protein] synthase-1